MPQEKEPQVGSAFLGKTVSRRALLGWGAKLGALAAASSACGGVAMGKNKAVPSATLPSELPTPVDLTPEKTRVIDLDGAQVYLNSDNLPEAYVGQDGVRVDFDIEEARKARETARIMGEEEVFKMFRVEVQHLNAIVVPSDYIEKHPVEAYLPKDTLTDAELRKCGIEIIQSDYTELHIRQGAFREGELLSGYTPDGKRKLKFVMLDTDVVSRHYLKDAKFNSVREYAPDYEDVGVVGLKEKMIDGYNSQIASNRRSRKEHGQEEGAHSTLELKTYLYRLQHLMSAQDLLDVSIKSAQLKGKDHAFVGGWYKLDNSGQESTAVIFVAMGEPPRSRDYLRIYFNAKGETVVDNFVNYAEGNNVTPPELQAYPGPGDFSPLSYINKAQDVYTLRDLTPGETTRHEAAHVFLGNNSENGADKEVFDSLSRARDEFDTTGDNSGYYFVLRSRNGAVILTKGKTETSPSQIAA
ncbi:MAG: hypothetical protein UT84_C0002G0065 [Candidatus Curtissbacteria bacterium GW2011_GWA1_40_16]|uniref:Uncharacterized protein n=1 Tax=Candidatus Curtissbacteria bacterium GW2011_GWA1_40_16 TaxID=1618405 RepID=A0A0G0REU0_9BACT|nr:MAG: hypothetical protein UT84_C0002G0065 [Candidatus Curtissbacteria bacterium GW2011_GWA1_40_16]